MTFSHAGSPSSITPHSDAGGSVTILTASATTPPVSLLARATSRAVPLIVTTPRFFQDALSANTSPAACR